MKESFTKDLKKSFSGDPCTKEECSHQSCTGDVCGAVRPRANFVKKMPVNPEKVSISSMERTSKNSEEE